MFELFLEKPRTYVDVANALNDEGVAGVVSWATGPGNSDGCGGLTGVTPLSAYRSWIVEQARRMGSPLPQ